MKFASMEGFVLVVVFFDHSPYKKSPVHDLNLHQNIFSRKWSQNEFGDTMKRKQPSGSKRLLYKSDNSYSGACGYRAFSWSFCLGWASAPFLVALWRRFSAHHSPI